VSDEVSELKVKRKTLQNDADALSTAADGMRRAAREKAEQLKEVNQLIDNKLLELENCP